MCKYCRDLNTYIAITHTSTVCYCPFYREETVEDMGAYLFFHNYYRCKDSTLHRKWWKKDGDEISQVDYCPICKRKLC